MEHGHGCFLTPGGLPTRTRLSGLLGWGTTCLCRTACMGRVALSQTMCCDDMVSELYYRALEGGLITSQIRGNTRLIWCESPGSSTIEVQDVPLIVEAAHQRGGLVALDNTWAAAIV